MFGVPRQWAGMTKQFETIDAEFATINLDDLIESHVTMLRRQGEEPVEAHAVVLRRQ